ncbi:EAL domain-containing protein [Pseudodesulfovibrio sp. JC047]|uniref:EAL domain-containing protein n=1 Tax=Pseudodesulfovibrio sp. JC047 TaxID=2683199 RepID=UPI0013D1C9A0|nr:EAL domain-containing protein [Pseudodesulfovibrio sp. JC047]
MVEENCSRVDEKKVRAILESRQINTYFQPVVAIASKSIIGFEAFSRVTGEFARCPDIRMLFHKDLSPELIVNVDRLCRDKALARYRSIHETHPDLLLYLNVNVDIMPHVDPDSAYLFEQIEQLGIAPQSVVVEGVSFAPDVERMAAFCAHFREHGLKVGLDGCAVDEPFNSAISRLKPDFIKINRSFFGDTERAEYSAKTLEGLISAADHVGASVIGCGVETEAESIRLLMAGVNLQQGYYYTRGEERHVGDPAWMFREKIVETYDKYLKVKNRQVRRKKERFVQIFKDVSSVCSKLSNRSEEWFEDGCKKLARTGEGIISLFVLDTTGRQITRRISSSLRQSASHPDVILKTDIGVSHSVEDYVLYLDIGYEKFVTPPFVSPFTGEKACLVSTPFFNIQGDRYIVCVEMALAG